MDVRKEYLSLNYKKVEKHLISSLKSAFKRRGFTGAVIGISGGIDSAVVLCLLSKALGVENVYSFFMPYKSTSRKSFEDANLVAVHAGVTLTKIDITESVDSYFKNELNPIRMRIGNKCARERMSILYDRSFKHSALVVGTSNRSEIVMGYGTQFGDLACALNPLGDLWKTQIFLLAESMGIPGVIIKKKPSADLWENQTDEGEMGISYREIDAIAYLYFEKGYVTEQINKLGYSYKKINVVLTAYERNEFKRQMPFIIKVNSNKFKGE